MGKRQPKTEPYHYRLFDIQAWRVYHLLTRDSDPDRLPIPADQIGLTLETWLDSGIFGGYRG